MREQRLEQLEAQRQEQNRDHPQPRQRGPDRTGRDSFLTLIPALELYILNLNHRNFILAN